MSPNDGRFVGGRGACRRWNRGLRLVGLAPSFVASALMRGAVRGGYDHLGMAQNFIGCDREQELLLPPSLREWLPESHLAWFVIGAVEALDLVAFYGSIARTVTAGRRTSRR
jgi:hypothetical protein